MLITSPRNEGLNAASVELSYSVVALPLAASITCTVDGTSVPEPIGVGLGAVGDASGDTEVAATAVAVEARAAVGVAASWLLPHAAANARVAIAASNGIFIIAFNVSLRGTAEPRVRLAPRTYSNEKHDRKVPALPLGPGPACQCSVHAVADPPQAEPTQDHCESNEDCGLDRLKSPVPVGRLVGRQPMVDLANPCHAGLERLALVR